MLPVSWVLQSTYYLTTPERRYPLPVGCLSFLLGRSVDQLREGGPCEAVVDGVIRQITSHSRYNHGSNTDLLRRGSD